ncbi:MAG: hypothetical protein ACREC4_11040, partial [Methylocella sp.]
EPPGRRSQLHGSGMLIGANRFPLRQAVLRRIVNFFVSRRGFGDETRGASRSQSAAGEDRAAVS